MPTNKQHREAERRRLQRQLEQRRAREAARKRMTVIGSIIATLVLVVAVVVIVVVSTGGSDDQPDASSTGRAGTSPSAAAPTGTASSEQAVPLPSKPCAAPPAGDTARFGGLTVKGVTDLKHAPKVSGKSDATPTSVICQDLVVGTGKAASTSSQVSVQYVGLVYKSGKVFQSSWELSSPVPPFSLAPGAVVDGFRQGIAGAGKIAPMHVGGRRLIIMPAAAGYGANPRAGSGIPPNAALAFIVDLQKVS